MKTALTFAFVLLAACGGKKAAEPTTATKTADEHGTMMPEIAKFHEVLSPLWHAEKGPKRMTDTCGAVPQFRTDADALVAVAAPAGADAAAWTTKTKELGDAVGALDVACKANDAAVFEPAFEHMHTGFHAVLDLSGGGHHEEHHDHHNM